MRTAAAERLSLVTSSPAIVFLYRIYVFGQILLEFFFKGKKHKH